MYLFIIH